MFQNNFFGLFKAGREAIDDDDDDDEEVDDKELTDTTSKDSVGGL